MTLEAERLQRRGPALVDLARLEAGSSPLHHDRVELPALLERVADEARLQAGAPTIEVHAPAGLTVPGDGERLHQVVANLVDNAVRYSPANGRVAIEAMPAAGSIEVRVTDEGPGIPEDERARVFERFYRSARARTNAGGGAGLGLAIAHWIVDLHGGTIRAEAAQPTGCCVVIALPNEPPTPVA